LRIFLFFDDQGGADAFSGWRYPVNLWVEWDFCGWELGTRAGAGEWVFIEGVVLVH
jgi:hypothetical protein